MSYVIQAVLSNAQHPEYGQVTIPFPIPNQNYDCTIELLEPLEIGDTLRQDCQVDELDSFYTVLNALIGTQVTLDELDYLAKRLDSFDDGEAAQFQGMAHKLGLSKIKDLINLTFCCQKATVITDFSDLEKIGREHYMNLNGGCARTEDLEALDGTETAYLLIDSGAGTVTPYGVAYDNSMKLEPLYNGRQFPEYLYDNSNPLSETTKWKLAQSAVVDTVAKTVHKDGKTESIDVKTENGTTYVKKSDLYKIFGGESNGISDYEAIRIAATENSKSVSWVADRLAIVYTGIPVMYGYPENAEISLAIERGSLYD